MGKYGFPLTSLDLVTFDGVDFFDETNPSMHNFMKIISNRMSAKQGLRMEKQLDTLWIAYQLLFQEGVFKDALLFFDNPTYIRPGNGELNNIVYWNILLKGAEYIEGMYMGDFQSLPAWLEQSKQTYIYDYCMSKNGDRESRNRLNFTATAASNFFEKVGPLPINNLSEEAKGAIVSIYKMCEEDYSQIASMPV